MKKILILSCVLLSLNACKQATQNKNTEEAVTQEMAAEPTAFSKEALAQKVYDVDGNESTVEAVIAQHKGNKVVLDIWASWCRDCIAAMPETAKLQAANPELKFVFLSVDVKEENWKNGIEQYINANNVKGDQYFFNTGWKRPKKDEGVENDFIKFAKLDWIPRYMVLDESGNIICYYAKSTKDDNFVKALEK